MYFITRRSQINIECTAKVLIDMAADFDSRNRTIIQLVYAFVDQSLLIQTRARKTYRSLLSNN